MVERGKERVQQIINGSVDKPARRKRSDAGTHRPAKAQAQPGVLTREQLEKLRSLINGRESKREAWEGARNKLANCQDEFVLASDELEAYLNALTAK